jgi:hypothetical protein
MFKRLIASIVVVLLFFCLSFPQIGGTVDWTNRVVKAKGIGAPNPNMPEAAARPAAIRAAKQLALRNALELIKGMALNSQTTIANSMVESDVVNTSVNGFVSGFEYEEKPHYMSDGTVEISVTLPFDGAKGIGQTLFGGSVNLVSDEPSATFRPSGVKSRAYSGLIIDAKGIGIKPALMPKILDEKDKEIYGSAYVSREFAVKYGMCGYSKDVKSAKAQVDRIGKSPCLVKAMSASGPNKADIVVGKKDADLIQSAAANMKFLSECRVIIVLD